MTADPLRSNVAGIALIGAVGEEYARILRANDRFAELLAKPLDALLGTRFCQHLHPDDHAQAHAAFLQTMADTKTLYENDAQLLAANGRVVRVHALASAITMRTGPAIILRVLALPH